MKSKEIKNNVFERILFRFLCYHYDWMKTPFNTKENTCATNGYSIVFIDKIEGYKDESKRLEPIIYNQENCSFEINAKDLLMALDKISMVSNSIECEDCEGDGKVVWSFYGSEKDYFEYFKCPLCEGSGFVNDNTLVKSKKEFIQIGNSLFNCDRINEILFIANELNQDKIKVTYQEERKVTTFQFNGVKLLCMPCINDKNYPVYKI